MVDTSDVLLAGFGFAISFYGGFQENQIIVVSGILVIIFAMYLLLQKQESDVAVIKAQINTQNELKRI